MPKKNKFKVDVVSVRLVKDAPIYSEHPFNSPYEVVSVMGDVMCELDREVVSVINLKSDLTLRDFNHCAGYPAWYELLADTTEDITKVFNDAVDIMILPINELFRKVGVNLIDFISNELITTKTISDWYNGVVECTPYERLVIARRINLL